MQTFQFGIDLGGTKTELIVLDQTGHERFRERVPTPASDYQAILRTIISLVRQAEGALGTAAQALGVGAPGTPFGPEGRLKNANTTCLIGQPLATDLQSLLNVPVIVENDANCLVLSEATDGAGAGAPVVFGVILGTGVGGGLVINGQLVNGPNRITGEWGHNPLPRWFDLAHGTSTPRACYCGLTDCIETYLSGKGLSLTYQALAPQQSKLLVATEIANAAQAGDKVSKAALSHYFDAVAHCLATVINVIDPNIIVFGGGLSQLPGLCHAVQGRLSQHVFGTDMQTELAVAMHGDSSGVRGAAWLTRHCLPMQAP
ncbi:MAG: ROK family protein [Burkholderiaceae bacterium]|nr:ROK family protein [Burkholderiaceae bacterium]MCD8536830.1 ROK family protein [Burkholderiaceae bacterium]